MIARVRRSAKELARDKAIAMLARTKSYEQWLATADPVRLKAAVNVSGSTRQFYDAMVSNMLAMAGPGYVLPAHLK